MRIISRNSSQRLETPAQPSPAMPTSNEGSCEPHNESRFRYRRISFSQHDPKGRKALVSSENRAGLEFFWATPSTNTENLTCLIDVREPLPSKRAQRQKNPN